MTGVTTTAQDTNTTAAAQADAADVAGAECPECGYDLRGLAEGTGRCPECGLTIDPLAAATSRVPWAHRRKIGLLRAYVATAVLVTLRPHRFVEEVARPAQRREALWFRAITVVLVLLPLAFMTTVETPFDPRMVTDAAQHIAEGRSSWEAWVVPAMYGAQWPAVRVACIAGALFTVTGAAARLVGTRGLTPVRRERALALAHYTCAPLLTVPLAFVVGLLLVVVPERSAFVVTAFLLVLPITVFLGVVDWWWVQVLLVQRATSDAGRAALAAVLLPVRWALLAGLWLFGVPWLLGWGRILVASLR